MSEGKRRYRSAEWFGKNDKDGFVHRSWMRNQGIPSHMFDGRPVIGICNTWSELTPCNAHFRVIAEHVRRGVLEAGGFPTEKRPFAPHVTLVRNVRHDAVPDTGADEVTHWQAGSFVLAGSQRFSDGARYRMLGRWSLS